MKMCLQKQIINALSPFSSFLGQNQNKSLPSPYQVGINSYSNYRHLYHSKQKNKIQLNGSKRSYNR